MELDDFARTASADQGLCVVSTGRDDGTVQSSLINAGVMTHPVTGEAVVGFVARGDSHKLRLLRRRPQITVVARAGWRWAGVEGIAELVGPDDTAAGITGDALRLLLRDVFAAAGGTHDDWDEYDRVMAAERRTAVFVTPVRAYGNPV